MGRLLCLGLLCLKLSKKPLYFAVILVKLVKVGELVKILVKTVKVIEVFVRVFKVGIEVFVRVLYSIH